MAIALKKIYEGSAQDDGYRVLIDHLWPRGLKKEDAQIDRWLKEIAPASNLMLWFGHYPEKWEEFKRRYFQEPDGNLQAVGELVTRIKEGRVTLLFAAREQRFNNAVALREYLEKKFNL